MKLFSAIESDNQLMELLVDRNILVELYIIYIENRCDSAHVWISSCLGVYV